MAATLDRVVEVIAPRLARLLAEGETSILHAPHEFAPVEVAEAAVALLDAGEPRDHYDVRRAADVLKLMPLLVRRKPAFLTWDKHLVMDQGVVARLVSQVVDAAGVLPPLVAVVEVDIAVPEVYLPFDLNLSQAALTLSPEEIREVGGQGLSALAARRIHEATSGVPRLVAAAVEDYLSLGRSALTQAARPSTAGFAAASEQGDASRGELVRVSRAWADRLMPQLSGDDLAQLHGWLTAIRADGVAALASEVLERPVTPEEVRRCQDAGAFVSPAPGQPRGLPVTLARAVVEASAQADPLAARARRRSIGLAAADDAVPLTALERVRLLSSISAWGPLNTVLARSMVHLVHMSTADRDELRAYWPDHVPEGWEYLSAAERFVDGSWRTGQGALPLPWLEMRYLFSAEDHSAIDDESRDVHEHLIHGLAQGQSSDVVEMRDAVVASHERLRGLTATSHERLVDPGASRALARSRAALICYALLGQADAYLAVASITSAQECVNEATALAAAAALDAHNAPALMAGLAARSAVLAAKAGVHERADHFLTQYEDVVAVTASRDAEPEQIVKISRRYRDDWYRLGAGALDVPEPTVVDVLTGPQYLPLEIEAEGYALLLARGPVVASQWLTGFLAKSRWIHLLPWQWWPLHALLAMIEVREGHSAAARQLLEGGTLPESIALVIEAGIELNAGHGEKADLLADRAAALPDTPDRWRLAAYGLKLATMEATRDREGGTDLLSGLLEWRNALSVVAMLPQSARRLILDRLGEEYADLPGLRLDESESERTSPATIELTHRQMDVLHGLEAGKTASEIAGDLALGRETIRTTTKALYRRLGVHSKASALQVARSVGLI